MSFTPRQFLSIALLGLLATHAQAQTSEGTAEVLGVQVSRLETAPMGSFKGTLPGNLFASSLAVDNWNTGTAVLLRIPAPRGAWLLPQAPKLVSFQDDTRKDLSRTPEGVAADPFNRRTPVTFVFHGDTGDMYVCVASLRAPSVSATKVGGEVEVAYSGEPVATVSEPTEPKAGTEFDMGPFKIKILEVRERTAGEGAPPMPQPSQLPPTMRGLPPQGMPIPPLPPGQTLPPGAMTPEQLSERVQSRPPAQMQPSKRMAIKCELIAPASGWIPVKLSVSDSKGNISKFSPELLGNASFTFTFSVKELAPFRVKLEAVNTDKAPVARIKFSSSLGVSKE